MNNEQEIWKQIPMFPTYAASNLGRIKNINKDRIMAQSPVDDRDYQKVCISYKNKPYTKKVSRLVWAAFNDCDCPDTIDHIDGNPKNNNITNLRCISGRLNCMLKHNYNKKINKFNLDDDKKKEILTKRLEGVSVWKLSREYKIPSNYLYTTFKRGSWNHLCWNNDTINTENSPGK
jgi:hypothetical protein